VQPFALHCSATLRTLEQTRPSLTLDSPTERSRTMTLPTSSSTATSTFTMPLKILRTTEFLTTLTLKILIFLRPTRFLYLRKTFSLLVSVMRFAIGSSKSTWTALRRIFPADSVNTAALKDSTKHRSPVVSATPCGNLASSLATPWSKLTPSNASSATWALSETTGTTTSMSSRTAPGATPCKLNTDLIEPLKIYKC